MTFCGTAYNECVSRVEWLRLFCSAMQIHIPDPAYTNSVQARANFRLAVKVALGFVALVWFIQLLHGLKSIKRR